MITEVAGAVAERLISREEHILGKKVIELAYKWGEPVAVQIEAIGWKKLKEISTLVVGTGLKHDDHVEMLIQESRPVTLHHRAGVNLDHLDAVSLAKLTSHCLALSLGESAIKRVSPEGEDPNGRPAGMPALPVTGSRLVGEQASNLSAPDMPMPTSALGESPD